MNRDQLADLEQVTGGEHGRTSAKVLACVVDSPDGLRGSGSSSSGPGRRTWIKRIRGTARQYQELWEHFGLAYTYPS